MYYERKNYIHVARMHLRQLCYIVVTSKLFLKLRHSNYLRKILYLIKDDWARPEIDDIWIDSIMAIVSLLKPHIPPYMK